jgi:hypothetical protein
MLLNLKTYEFSGQVSNKTYYACVRFLLLMSLYEQHYLLGCNAV